MNYNDIKLPPLPAPISREIERQYSAQQLEAYAREAVRLNSCKAAITKQQEAEPVDDGAMFDWIDARARETFSRHKSGARGQQITAADNPESHLIWAALAWARLHPPKPAAQPQVPDVDEIYKRFCAWCRENEWLDLDPRLHTHSGNSVSVGGYISHRVTSIAFRAFRDGLLSAGEEEGK